MMRASRSMCQRQLWHMDSSITLPNRAHSMAKDLGPFDPRTQNYGPPGGSTRFHSHFDFGHNKPVSHSADPHPPIILRDFPSPTLKPIPIHQGPRSWTVNL